MLLSLMTATACGPSPTHLVAAAPQPSDPSLSTEELPPMERQRFNLRAAEHGLPLFWTRDQDADGILDADELAVLWGLDDSQWSDWVDGQAFTHRFRNAYAGLATRPRVPDGVDAPEKRRRAKVLEALAAARRTLVLTDLTEADAEEQAIVEHIINAATLIERLYAKQRGVHGLRAQIPAEDTASQALFHRNLGPWCVAPGLEQHADCHALASRSEQVFGLYPAALQKDPKFCQILAAHPDHKTLLSPFTAVTAGANGPVAVAYTAHFRDDMNAVSQALRAAASAITSPGEAAFRAYLKAAAQAFVDNHWEPADEAWAAMDAQNSKWYLRIAPDEVYFEPCNSKAGFHLSFARINQDSLRWQNKLGPLVPEMETTLAKLAGPPYSARKVEFDLPDFIDIIINAGDSRDALGATVGQSLPNWGPVANEGRGRTVAMTNLYTDPDSKVRERARARSVLCPSAMGHFADDNEPRIMSTVLHEAAHNLGPAHEYQVDGKTAREIFGGPMASTLEELKAQTAALFFSGWLAGKGIITADLMKRTYTQDVLWSFSQMSRGLYSPTGRARPYPQLAAIQAGYLMDQGVLVWHADQQADNGKDQGCFELRLDDMSAPIRVLMERVARIKSAGDKAAAEAAKQQYVDDDGAWKQLRALITQRWLRTPKASFVYAVKGRRPTHR